jgi:hypothetical protein
VRRQSPRGPQYFRRFMFTCARWGERRMRERTVACGDAMMLARRLGIVPWWMMPYNVPCSETPASFQMFSCHLSRHSRASSSLLAASCLASALVLMDILCGKQVPRQTQLQHTHKRARWRRHSRTCSQPDSCLQSERSPSCTCAVGSRQSAVAVKLSPRCASLPQGFSLVPRRHEGLLGRGILLLLAFLAPLLALGHRWRGRPLLLQRLDPLLAWDHIVYEDII